jgi:hypothetical protein
MVKFTRKANTKICGGQFMIGQGRVLSAMWTQMGKGVLFAIFENGMDFVPSNPIPVAPFQKMLRSMKSKPGVYEYRSKTPEEFAALASAAGAYKKFNAAWFRKEMAFMQEQTKAC